MKNVNLTHLFLGFEGITKVEYEVDGTGRGTMYLWQRDDNGHSEIVMSIGLNEASGKRAEFKIEEPAAAEPVYRGKLRQFAPTTLAAAERRLRRGWSSNASLRRVTGLAYSSIPAMLTDLRRSGVKIERRRGFVGQWRVANV